LEVAMKRAFLVTFISFMLGIVFMSNPVHSAQTINAVKVTQAPAIDGSGNDAAWKSAHTYTIYDERTKVDIILKAVYSADMVFFLVQYPDSNENILHKPWVWDKELEAYKIGTDREDTFIFKWNMEKKKVDLSNFSDDAYTADVWYWKANRTNPAGYADDKSQVLASTTPGKKAKEITSKTGKKRYLVRIGDKGKSAQKKTILAGYKGDIQNQYISRTPEGSRADVRAKGVWKDGTWTIEFGRKLNTGNADDVQFNPASKKKYLFGISIKSLYGEAIDNSKVNWYGQGRISEKLYLIFQ
jgi:hypothetical protein